MSSLTPYSGSPNRTRALLSIRPPYANAILRGEKRYEYRRTSFSRSVDVVLMYVTAPVSKVVAEFDVLSVITRPLSALWRNTQRHAGIDKDFFYAYFRGREIGHAIEIGEVRRYDKPFCPTEELGLKPPQSFAYVPCSMGQEVGERSIWSDTV